MSLNCSKRMQHFIQRGNLLWFFLCVYVCFFFNLFFNDGEDVIADEAQTED